MTDKIEKIKINELIPFENHPFKVRRGEEQTELLESIRFNGTLVPIIVRSSSADKYEIISGHRRVEACKELGTDTIPAIVKELTYEEAVITMADANLQRENLLPSEKAFAYKMKMEAITFENIYTIMKNFGSLYDIISDDEKKSLISFLIKEIQIYPKEESEQILKSIEFNFPIYCNGEEVRKLLWESGNTVECVTLLQRKNT